MFGACGRRLTRVRAHVSVCIFCVVAGEISSRKNMQKLLLGLKRTLTSIENQRAQHRGFHVNILTAFQHRHSYSYERC